MSEAFNFQSLQRHGQVYRKRRRVPFTDSCWQAGDYQIRYLRVSVLSDYKQSYGSPSPAAAPETNLYIAQPFENSLRCWWQNVPDG
jgi:hypothetical protein